MDRPELSKPEPDADEFVASPSRDWGDDWVHELIEMTRPGAEINLHNRGLGDRVIPFQFDDFS
jgi:hypothetical protein